MHSKTDEELIRIMTENPESNEATSAQVELEFRQYKTMRSYNFRLMVFTFVLAICAIIEAIAIILQ